MELTKFVKLIALRQGEYTNYVFKDLESDEYFFCSRMPNWQVPEVQINEKGFVQIKDVKAGEEYVMPDGSKHNYKYNCRYFINFVLHTDKPITKEKIIL